MIAFVVAVFCGSAQFTLAKTTVSNTVHVSANSSEGTGVSHASVTTVVNGEVVESWSATSTDPITYHSSMTHAGTAAAEVSTTATTDEPDPTILRQLIAQLQALIALYVTLLQQQ